MFLFGVIIVCEVFEGCNVCLDSVVYVGFEVLLYYDLMIVKFCCWGCNCDLVILNMVCVLCEYKILGIKIMIFFYQCVLKNVVFLKGEYDIIFIDMCFDKEDLKCRQNIDLIVVVIVVVLKYYEEEKEVVLCVIMFLVVGDLFWKYYGKL